MTCREKLKMEHPEWVDEGYYGGCSGCPEDYGYLPDPDECECRSNYDYAKCSSCWNREIPDDESPLDSKLDIYALIDDAMQKRDRSVAIYIHPENGMSVTIYPWPDEE